MANDVVRRVLIRFEVDTSKAEDGFDKLKEKTEESSKSFGEWAKHLNESFNETIEKLGSLNQAFEGLHKIIEVGREGFKEYADDMRLHAAAGAADIERLSEAAGGLVRENDLLSFAAKAQHGIFKLTQEQMELVEQAELRLTRAGFDHAEVAEKVEGAVISLKTKGLDRLGVSVKEGTTDVEKFNNIMEALNKKATDQSTATEGAGESVQRMGVRWQNALEDIMKAIGELVVALGPLLDVVAKIVGTVAQGLKYAKGIGALSASDLNIGQLKENMDAEKSMEEMMSGIRGSGEYGEMNRDEANISAAFGLVSGIGGGIRNALNDPWRNVGDTIDARLKSMKARYDAAKAKAEQLAEERKKLANAIAKSSTDDLVKQLEAEEASASADSTSAFIRANAPIGSAKNDNIQASIDRIGTQLKTAAANQKRETLLQSIFGKPEEYEMYKGLWSGLSDTITAGYEAIVKGNESVGDALKKAAATSLLTMGAKWAVQAVGEGAEAIAAAADYDYEAAGQHAAAAAKFAAGAVLAGVVASELGAGGSTSTAGTGADAGGSTRAGGSIPVGGSSSSSGGGQTNIIVYGEVTTEQTARMRRLQSEALVKKVLGSSAMRNV